MTRQRTRKAQAAVRVRGLVAAIALAAMAMHMVAGAAAHHSHDDEEEEEACSLCAAFSSEDDAVQPCAARRLAVRRAEPGLGALPAPLAARKQLPYLPRGPPTLCR